MNFMGSGQGLMARRVFIFAHDVVATLVALSLALSLRFTGDTLAARAEWLYLIVPAFVLYACLVYWLSQLYRTKWRFVSLADLFNIFRVSTVLAVTLLILD